MIEILDQRGKAAEVKGGQTVQVIDTHGKQVADTWAFNAKERYECTAMEAIRTKLCLEAGDAYVSNHRRAMLTVI